ncbi:hypothetical protein EW146_g5709 [Bondarzewia mesenterica]|uniref:BTB domain-containing protein n=1 Tax=Bondarzewia mesenterica TaxID=1095465 RepID=A0A4S4LWE1_9AGAM|nr:hypothetical protein EW146_g5709 [Bondarzewia mesenterica]
MAAPVLISSNSPTHDSELVPRDANPPFDSESADTIIRPDIILRSFDCVDFHVHKVVLALASPFFKDMFSLPQAKGISSTQADAYEHKNGMLVVRMAEDSRTLELLLGFCYPMPNPSLEDFDDTMRAFRAAEKLQVDIVLQAAKSKLSDYAEEHPERVFAIAWTFKIKDLVLIAARHSLRNQFVEGPVLEEFSDLPAAAFIALFKYRRSCVSQASNLTVQHRWVTNVDLSGLSNPIARHCKSCGGKSAHFAGGSRTVHVPLWWWDYNDAVRSALEKTPCESTATSLDLISASLKKVAECSYCNQGAHSALHRYAQGWLWRSIKPYSK